MQKHTHLLIALLLTLAFFLSATLIIFSVLYVTGNVAVPYEDTNGPDDYSLQVLTDQDILHGVDHIKIASATIKHNKLTTCTAKTMSGVETLFEASMDNETFRILVSCKIDKGNARLVLVVDEKIVHDFALNEENQLFVMKNVCGKIYLRLAGESAGYSVTYQLQ